MEISDNLLCYFSTTVEEREDSYVIEVPKREVGLGTIDAGDIYRVAMVGIDSTDDDDATTDGARAPRAEPRNDHSAESEVRRTEEPSRPPVSEGDTRRVTIEDIGEQGDGIARVERGFVIIVPDTERDEKVRIEITDVKDTVAFGEVVEREGYITS